MKKAIILLCLAVGLMSCAKEISVSEKEDTQTEGVPMTFNVNVLETKATKTSWASGDKIYVFFNGLETKYLILTYDGSRWGNTSGGGNLLNTDFSSLGTKKLTAVHFPVAVDVTYADSKFSFTSGGEPVYNYYLFETGKDYTVDGTTVNATLSLGKPGDMVQIHVAGIQSSVADYTFGCSKMKPVACASVGPDGAITESVLQAGARVSGVSDTDGGVFAGRLVYPDVAKDYVFTIGSNNKIYTLIREDKALTSGKIYKFPSLSTTGGTNWAVQNASDLYVDLGLSVKWAKCNVDASAPEEYGGYYAWGETTEKSRYDTDTYLFWTAGDSHQDIQYSKYVLVSEHGQIDNKRVLDPIDDVATVRFGGNWRMPTYSELSELRDENNCEWTWEIVNGTSGYRITSLIAGYENNSIFLPASGFYYFASSEEVHSRNVTGTYWSSFLHLNDTNYPGSIYFNHSHIYGTTFQHFREWGCSVRPVFGELVRLSNIEIPTSSIQMTVGESRKIIVSYNPSNASEQSVMWTSSDMSIASIDTSVDSKGIVTAQAPGVATITATSMDGWYSASCTITVE